MDETDPGSYMPIALLNYDLKIIAKVLVSRLGKNVLALFTQSKRDVFQAGIPFVMSIKFLILCMQITVKTTELRYCP